MTIKNSTNNAEIVAKYDKRYNRAGGFVGGLGQDSCKQVNFENCTNNGNVTVTGYEEKKTEGFIVMAGGFIGSVNGTKKTMTVTNCTNNGTITATNSLTKGTKTVKGMDGSGIDETGWVKVYAIYAGYNGQ